MVGAIEGGGTKFICAVGTGPERLTARIEYPTTTAAETLGRAIEFFEDQRRTTPVAAVGIACFGPLDLDPASPTYGYLTSTPKERWGYVDLAGPIRRALRLPVALDTDVNAAALAEQRWGAARDLDTFVYLTVGTGIGGGGMVGGRLIHGLLHPEMGHMRIPHDRAADPFGGTCPFHEDCWEGLAAGPAIAARWGTRGEHLPADSAAWELEARYLALGLNNIVCAMAPQRVILGGGVMKQAQLFPLIRRELRSLLNDYFRLPAILEHIDRYVVPPQLGGNAGVLGAMALALDAQTRRSPASRRGKGAGA
jgi:fructokinase